MALPVINDPESSVEIALEDGSVWLRSGSCNRCGECCRWDPWDRSLAYCRYFRWADEAKTIGECTDRTNPYYLSGCNVYPTTVQCLETNPSCSYTFTRVR